MGGNGGGNVTSGEFDDLERRILERLKGLARDANKIMFACESTDARSLTSHLTRAGLQMGDKVSVAVGPDVEAFAPDIGSIQLLVTFADTATDVTFLDRLVEVAFAAKKQGIHVRVQSNSLIPGKTLAYRWRVMSWDELLNVLG